MSARMNECHPISFKFLHDETLTSKKSGSKFTLESDSYIYTLCRTQERVFLTNDSTIQLLEVEWNNFTRIRRGKRDPFLPTHHIGESGHEQAFAGQ